MAGFWESMPFDDDAEGAPLPFEFNAPGKPDLFLGDYYAEPADTVRGVTLAPADFLGLSAPPACPDFDLPGKTVDKGFSMPHDATVPAAPFGGLAASTTIVVPHRSATARQLAAATERFLNESEWALVTKTNPAKYSIRATVRTANGGSCDFKARMFQAPLTNEAHALELRKMRGDPITFVTAFRRLAEDLATQFPGLCTMSGELRPASEQVDLGAPVEPADPVAEDFAPLVELATDGMHLAEQVDAIAALAGLTCAAAGAALASVISSGSLDALLRHADPGIAEAAKLAVPTLVGHHLQESSSQGLDVHVGLL